MPEDSKPELTAEAAAQLQAASSVGMETAPLRIPPGCSATVEVMVLEADSSITAPSAEPPGAAGFRAGSFASSSAPTQEPPKG
jgi:hypothetical protein